MARLAIAANARALEDSDVRRAATLDSILRKLVSLDLAGRSAGLPRLYAPLRRRAPSARQRAIIETPEAVLASQRQTARRRTGDTYDGLR
jgi:hypothetical protein